MNDETYMRVAIEEAKKSKEPLKCGVVIVKDDVIIASAYNTQREDNNATAHAEINAIAIAGKTLESKYLQDCVLYGTCEPCTMCLSAMVFSKINRLVYGVSLVDVSPKLIKIDIDSFLSKSPYKFKVTKNFMQKECMTLI